MPKIIPLENEIKNLENFLQSYDKDDKFKEFANAFILAVDENKNKINVNDINQIKELIMQNRSQENAEFIYNSLIFVDDLARDGVINYQNLSSEINTKIHNEIELNKRLDLIAEQIKQQKPKVEPKTDYSNLNFVEILQNSKPKQPIIADDEEQKSKLRDELENELQANAILRNTTIPISEIINNPSYNKNEISPDEVIQYIKVEFHNSPLN